MTRPLIRKLSPGGSITEHGITFERKCDGDGVFSVNIMVDRQRIHRVVGRRSDGTTRQQAEDYIAQLRTDAKHNRLHLPKNRKTSLSFREAASKYIQKLRESGGNDVDRKEKRLILHLVPFFGPKPLFRITDFDVERYKKKRRSEKALNGKADAERSRVKETTVKAATINRELAVLSHLLRSATDWGWIDQQPCRIRRLREGTGRITYLTAEEAKLLLEAAKGDSNRQTYLFIRIGLDTGMRLNEILNIRKGDIDFEHRRIHISKAKAGPRDQPVTARLAIFLRHYCDSLPTGTDWIFPSSSAKSGRTNTIRKAMRRAVKAAGLDPDVVTPHVLRHTAITHLVQSGIDLPTVKRISGHKTLSMVERYAHANGEHISTAMQKLQARYDLAKTGTDKDG